MMRIAAVGLVAAMAVQELSMAAQVRPTFRARVDLVQVDALVLDRGEPVTGLTASDFELRDDDVLQRIDAVSLEQMPLDVLLVFDTSKSVAGQPLADLTHAGEAFIGALDGRDRAALITFSDQPSLRMPLTGNIRSLGESLRSVSAQTSTALLDALELALAPRSGSDRRTVLLLFTDGQDNSSWLTPDQMLAAAHLERDGRWREIVVRTPHDGVTLATRPRVLRAGILNDVSNVMCIEEEPDVNHQASH